MTDDKPLPTGTPTAFEVKRVEIKKTLPPKDGKKPAVVLKLGLVGPAGEKGWAEMFVPDGTLPPGEGTTETLTIEPAENPNWLPKVSRPRKPGWGGGQKKNDASIEAQVAFKGAVELAIHDLIPTSEIEAHTKIFADAIRKAAK